MHSTIKQSFLFILFSLVMIPVFSFASKTPTSNAELTAALESNKGKVIYIDFWASWCAPCRKSFPWMNKIQTKYNSNEFTVISINVDQEKSLATAFLKKTPARFPVVYDPEGLAAKAFKLKGMPSSYLIDQQGYVVQSHTGFFIKKIPQYEQEINQLIAKNSTKTK